MKFSLGRVVMTIGVATEMENDIEFMLEVNESLKRFSNCDWGDTLLEGSEMNNSAVENGDDRILAVYSTSKGRIWIITEWDKSATTILFPSEY